MRRERRRNPHGSHERWLVSYADFITLLFAFFVVLYASSKADQKKQVQVSQAIDSAFHQLGLFPSSSIHPELKNVSAVSRNEVASPPEIVMGAEVMSPSRVKDELSKVQKDLEKMLSGQIAQHTVSISMGKDGLVISLREAGFFSSGSATPHKEMLPVLQQVATTLGRAPFNVRIEGHTDNVPIHNAEFETNWELSAARATKLARIFVATQAIGPERISAAGYAEFHPVVSNETAEGRAQNRRVDLVVMPRTVVNLAMPDGESSKATWQKITDQ